MTVRAIKKVQPVNRPAPIRRRVNKLKTLPSRKPVMKKVPHIEKWANARFHYNDIPGGTMTCSPNLKKERFVDGEEYKRPVKLFEEMNEIGKVSRFKLVPGSDGQVGSYVKTKAYDLRLYWEILERFDKKTTVMVVDEEATKAQNK